MDSLTTAGSYMFLGFTIILFTKFLPIFFSCFLNIFFHPLLIAFHWMEKRKWNVIISWNFFLLFLSFCSGYLFQVTDDTRMYSWPKALHQYSHCVSFRDAFWEGGVSGVHWSYIIPAALFILNHLLSFSPVHSTVWTYFDRAQRLTCSTLLPFCHCFLPRLFWRTTLCIFNNFLRWYLGKGSGYSHIYLHLNRKHLENQWSNHFRKIIITYIIQHCVEYNHSDIYFELMTTSNNSLH